MGIEMLRGDLYRIASFSRSYVLEDDIAQGIILSPA
jgi:hypothetical protein